MTIQLKIQPCKWEKIFNLSLTVNGLRDLALKRELTAKSDLTWVGLGDILWSRTVAAESSEKLLNASSKPRL